MEKKHNKITKKDLSYFISQNTGLSVIYVKKIIDFHNGKIDLESKKGVGTKFYITLKNI